MKKGLLIFDAGHASDTPGKRTPAFADGTVIHEHEFNQPVVDLCVNLAKSYGFDTLDTAPGAPEVSLQDRVKRANDAAKSFAASNPGLPILFVSVHYNAHVTTWEGSKAEGAEVFHMDKSSKSKALAEAIRTEIMKGTKQVDRGVRTSDFYVLVHTTMPAVLIEFGFMDDPAEAARMKNPAYQSECANEILDGVHKYLGIPKDTINKPVEKPAETWKHAIVREAYANGLISDLDTWLADPDQPMPSWAVLSVCNKLKEGQ